MRSAGSAACSSSTPTRARRDRMPTTPARHQRRRLDHRTRRLVRHPTALAPPDRPPGRPHHTAPAANALARHVHAVKTAAATVQPAATAYCHPTAAPTTMATTSPAAPAAVTRNRVGRSCSGRRFRIMTAHPTSPDRAGSPRGKEPTRAPRNTTPSGSRVCRAPGMGGGDLGGERRGGHRC